MLANLKVLTNSGSLSQLPEMPKGRTARAKNSTEVSVPEWNESSSVLCHHCCLLGPVSATSWNQQPRPGTLVGDVGISPVKPVCVPEYRCFGCCSDRRFAQCFVKCGNNINENNKLLLMRTLRSDSVAIILLLLNNSHFSLTMRHLQYEYVTVPVCRTLRRMLKLISGNSISSMFNCGVRGTRTRKTHLQEQELATFVSTNARAMNMVTMARMLLFASPQQSCVSTEAVIDNV